MSGYLIDTDRVIDSLHGQARAVQARVDLAPAGLAVSLITYAELYEGAYYARNPVAALTDVRLFLQGKRLLKLTFAVLERFAVLRGALSRSARAQVGDMDLLIAATAIQHDLVLLTRNVRDFNLIPGLSLYQAN